MGTGHQATGWAAWGWCPGGLSSLPRSRPSSEQSWTGPETPLGGREPHSSGPSGWSSVPGTGEGEDCRALRGLLLPPATLEGVSGLERREKGKVSRFEDQEGKGEGRETPERGAETERGQRQEEGPGYREQPAPRVRLDTPAHLVTPEGSYSFRIEGRSLSSFLQGL